MFDNVYIGKYYPADSFLHKLNSTAKIITIILLLISIVFISNLLFIIPFIIISILILLFSGVPSKLYLKNIMKLKMFLILIIVFNLIIYGLNFYPTILLLLKFILIVIYTTGLTFTTSPNEITYGLEKTFWFLKVFRIPVSELALAITLSLRFIPVVLESANKILKSQASRGIDFKYSKINGKIKAISSMLTPMFILAFKRADELGESMEMKLYGYSDKRTNYRMNNWSVRDTIIIFMNFIILIGVIVSEVVF